MQKTIFSKGEDRVQCPLCGSDHAVKNGRYVVKGGKRESIQRWLCKKCGAKFNDATSYVPRDPLALHQPKKLRKISKRHLIEKAELRQERLKAFIADNGFPKINTVKASLGMSVASYYKALTHLMKEQELPQRSNKNFENPKMLLLEVKKSNRSTGQKIVFYLVIDLITKKIIASFILQKKRQGPLNPGLKLQNSFFDYSESLSIYDFYDKCFEAQKLMPNLVIFSACSPRLNKNLFNKFPNHFVKCPTEIKKSVLHGLEKAGFNRTISFTKTLVQVAPKEISKVKGYDLEKRKPRSKEQFAFSKNDILKTVRLLSFIYNHSTTLV